MPSGTTSMDAMSPATAALYHELRGLIEEHVREFEPGKADDARINTHVEMVNVVADAILAEPVRTSRDLVACAEVLFWFQWSGIDPQGPQANAENGS